MLKSMKPQPPPPTTRHRGSPKYFVQQSSKSNCNIETSRTRFHNRSGIGSTAWPHDKRSSSAGDHNASETRSLSTRLELLGQFVSGDTQVAVVAELGLGFTTSMQHGRVVATTEVLADLMIAGTGQLPR